MGGLTTFNFVLVCLGTRLPNVPSKKYFCDFGVIQTLFTGNNIKSLTNHRQEVRYLTSYKAASFINPTPLCEWAVSTISSTTYIS